MLITMLIGVVAAVAVMLLISYTQKNKLQLQWWHWALTGLAILFAVFTAEVIHAFVVEGAAQAATITGLILGLLAVIWFVLLGRFVFAKAGK